MRSPSPISHRLCGSRGGMTSPGGATCATLTTPLKLEKKTKEVKKWTMKRKIKDKLIGSSSWVYPKKRMLVKIALAGRFRLQKLIVFW